MDNENLIECVRGQPHIWNKQDPFYKDINFKERTWETISIELSCTALQCKTRWRTLRDKCKRELKSNNEPSGSGASPRKPWPLMKSMSFLRRSMESRNTSVHGH
ncbi:transcription factor Adf-1-like [Musca autumnalis]|uniref:transcription factor Adf-1-like n=1 Tax=Musca autumnalis TaxID=221902 RepID=UPI003CF47E10